ncbi:MAG TPA: SDR family NAD(P)-dependent oxidoreductase [Acidimicrobiia bacterium]
MRTALITGPSSGIGRATALSLSRLGLHIVAAGRSRERTQALVDQISIEGGSAEYLHLDLASLTSVRQAAVAFVQSGRPLHVLINNAGVGAANGVTQDGFEIHWGVNHLGHFLLTNQLAPALVERSRVVSVSSDWHYRARNLHLDRVRGRGWVPFGLGYYATTKTANILFTRELARRHPEWECHAVHPGLTNTNLIPWGVRLLAGGTMLTPEEAADTVVWCATSDEVAGQSGLYYARRQIHRASPLATDDDLAAELWERSMEWVKG